MNSIIQEKLNPSLLLQKYKMSKHGFSKYRAVLYFRRAVYLYLILKLNCLTNKSSFAGFQTYQKHELKVTNMWRSTFFMCTCTRFYHHSSTWGTCVFCFFFSYRWYFI